jgi:hypothetical protein
MSYKIDNFGFMDCKVVYSDSVLITRWDYLDEIYAHKYTAYSKVGNMYGRVGSKPASGLRPHTCLSGEKKNRGPRLNAIKILVYISKKTQPGSL